ncbi:signal transducer and activator of transcription 1-alpha/beta-like isoform X2 [Dunckerocampus dactyliophorus]|uniref:signal transducer and activator of transcription 1-alpha/beta-like isoform X2 n=1 Tax=Dunckerocampus dactyliophorus TaxID=161453 RepID=UPI002406D7E8|nr:signal transducer and activator of transcription 1-alpha/beta-like isoform X2 [Dunckerocampus dactyliophorus]
MDEMTQWAQLQVLQDPKYLEQVDQLYDDSFPMEVRQRLSEWIESIDWDSVSDDESLATIRFHDLLAQMDDQRSHFDLLQQHNLRKIKGKLQETFQEDPVHMARIISKKLKDERRILASAKSAIVEEGEATMSAMLVEKRNLDRKVKIMRDQAQMANQDMKNLEERWRTGEKELKNVTPKEVETEKMNIGRMCSELNAMRQNVVLHLTELLNVTRALLSDLISAELPEWKRRQQIACIGGPSNACLGQLQNWFTAVAETLQQVLQHLKKLQKFTFESDTVTQKKDFLEAQALELFKNLLTNALVVESQPCMPAHPQRPLVLKTGIKFTVLLRFLVKLPMLKFWLKVKAVFDKDVTDSKGFRKFNMLGTNTKVMNTEDPNGSLQAEFRDLQLKEQKVTGSRNSEASQIVTKELHSLSFESVLQLSQSGINVQLEALSLPVVVISHVNQLPGAWASILWYNMLTSEPKKLQFFQSPPAAKWSQLSEVLSWQFSSVTKRGLSNEQLGTLADLLLGPNAERNPDGLIAWSKFYKPPSANKKVNSFWLWIDGTLDLIQKHLLVLWNDGIIMGFISKERAMALLSDKCPGTFLLRFSESSKEGAITFMWIEHDLTNTPIFHSVAPYKKKDLSAVSLADSICTYKWMAADNIPYEPLTFLYPNIPKHEAFGKYYTQNFEPPEPMDMDVDNTELSGYIGKLLISVSVVHPSRLQEKLMLMSPGVFESLEQFVGPSDVDDAMNVDCQGQN